MALNLQNIDNAINKLKRCDTSTFRSTGDSYKYFTLELKVNSFRHLHDLTIGFNHPVTVISGTNKIGKTSLLLILACSHEKFMKIDSTSPAGELREHSWADVLSFTSHEDVNSDYSYELTWRVGQDVREGEGKRLSSSKAWSGLGKKSSETSRINAKIRDRVVRLVDLERVLPGRSFSNALLKKANTGEAVRLNEDIEKAYSYIFETDSVEISEVGNHINKSCFLIKFPEDSYSSFNAASGEESVICLLKDLIESPVHSLILIDEVEAGFHPSIQRRLADIIQYISWHDKKQFVVSTHSPTLLSAFPPESRRFIERSGNGYRTINAISRQAARSKMDSVGDPLVHLYCEDSLASFLLMKICLKIASDYQYFERLITIICSGPANLVKNDYEGHKRNYTQLKNKIGYCAVLDGDKVEHHGFSNYYNNSTEKVAFIYPFEAPEKFLVRAYLHENSNSQLSSALAHSDHHSLFQAMVDYGLSADENDARMECYNSFKKSPEYSKHESDLRTFLMKVVKHFSEASD